MMQSPINGQSPGLGKRFVRAIGLSAFGEIATFSQFTLMSAGQSDIFVAKYDPEGQLLWVRQAGGSGVDLGRGIVLDGAANVYVTGHFSSY